MYGKEPAPEPIIVIDKFLHPEIFLQAAAELAQLHPWQREVDFQGAAPVGETCDLAGNTAIHRAITQELRKLFLLPWKIDRFYVNRFQPKEIPQFHADGEVITCVFYADPVAWQPDDHGETQLLINGEIRGILPVPNRMLIFDGRLLHRATSFQTRQRHTVAAKLEGIGLADIVLPGAVSQKP